MKDLLSKKDLPKFAAELFQELLVLDMVLELISLL
jgi:hypothetical protein